MCYHECTIKYTHKENTVNDTNSLLFAVSFLKLREIKEKIFELSDDKQNIKVYNNRSDRSSHIMKIKLVRLVYRKSPIQTIPNNT